MARSTRAPVKEVGVGWFGNKATCLTCNEVASDPARHVEEKHLLSVECAGGPHGPHGEGASG
jgi:hypothetical protein